MSYIEPFINNFSNNINDDLYKKEELFEIIKRIENNFKIIHNNINNMNDLISDKINISKFKDFITTEQKEYNKIMNKIYKFDVDE
jgi:hypothetical protein